MTRAEAVTGIVDGACMVSACVREPAPNLLIATFDTTRYDRIGVNGDPGARTPSIDRLAARGIVFDRAYASTGLTLPSHTTILSGLEPLTHGVRANGHFEVPGEIETLAERLRAEGYATAAFVSAFVLDSRFGLDQGFEVYEDEIHSTSSILDARVPRRPGEVISNEATDWIARSPADRPFFAWVHYYDPHRPWSERERFAEIGSPYAAEIAYADEQLGRVLGAIEEAPNGRPTLVVFTADHGESLGEHGELTHGIVAYDSTLHVPLVVSGPGVPEGRRSAALARHVDILPTVLRRLGLSVPEGLPGRDLVAASPEDDERTRPIGIFGSWGPHFDWGWAAVAGVRDARWKLTVEPEPIELYDVVADPGELRNVATERRDVVEEMTARWKTLRAEWERAHLASKTTLSPDEIERLAALGYVHSGGGVEAPAEAPDPRSLVSIPSWVDEARHLAREGRFDPAVVRLELLAKSDPIRGLALRALAATYETAGRYDDAIRAFRSLGAATSPESAVLSVARVLLLAGRPEEALTELDALRSSRSLEAGRLRAIALFRLGRREEALAAVEHAFPGAAGAKARRRFHASLVIDEAPTADGEKRLRTLLAEDPDDGELRSRLGFYLAAWGGGDARTEAEALLRGVLAADPADPDVLGRVAWGLHKIGLDEDAAAILETVLETDPGRTRERFQFGIVRHALGDDEAARREAERALRETPAASWVPEARDLLGKLGLDPLETRRRKP